MLQYVKYFLYKLSLARNHTGGTATCTVGGDGADFADQPFSSRRCKSLWSVRLSLSNSVWYEGILACGRRRDNRVSRMYERFVLQVGTAGSASRSGPKSREFLLDGEVSQRIVSRKENRACTLGVELVFLPACEALRQRPQEQIRSWPRLRQPFGSFPNARMSRKCHRNRGNS